MVVDMVAIAVYAIAEGKRDGRGQIRGVVDE